ncbi:hypothetical protein BsWGS_25972 [Bradybaena similaris]
MMIKCAVFVICAVLSVGNCAETEVRRGFVGFSASLNEITSFPPGQTVKYPNVITNVGNHYDPLTGVFKAPRTGYYLFHISALTNYDSQFWFQLIHNGVSRISIHGTGFWIMGANSVLLQAKAGDVFYVRTYQGTSDVWGDNVKPSTTFTGYLVGQ